MRISEKSAPLPETVAHTAGASTVSSVPISAGAVVPPKGRDTADHEARDMAKKNILARLFDRVGIDSRQCAGGLAPAQGVVALPNHDSFVRSACHQPMKREEFLANVNAAMEVIKELDARLEREPVNSVVLNGLFREGMKLVHSGRLWGDELGESGLHRGAIRELGKMDLRAQSYLLQNRFIDALILFGEMLRADPCCLPAIRGVVACGEKISGQSLVRLGKIPLGLQVYQSESEQRYALIDALSGRQAG